MPEQRHDSEVIILGVTGQLLDGDDERVLEQVIVYHAMGHRDVIVIPTRGKQRISSVKLDIPDCIGVIAKNLQTKLV